MNKHGPFLIYKQGRSYLNAVSSLRKLVDTLKKDSEYLFSKGLRLLELHRKNYTLKGPQHLKILWREWSQIHWDKLRNGAYMNFMVEPKPGLVPNQQLKGPIITAAIKFVDGIISLEVLRQVSPDEVVLKKNPLFLDPNHTNLTNSELLLMENPEDRTRLASETYAR